MKSVSLQTTKSLYALDPSTITILPTMRWAGDCGVLLRTLHAPVRLGTARTHGTTRCGIGPTTFPRQKVSTMARGEAETTHTVRRAQGKSRAGDGTPGKLHRPALYITRRRQYVVFF